MRPILELTFMSAGILAGFGAWHFLRRKPEHTCDFETLIRTDLETTAICGVQDAVFAEWAFCVCKDKKCLMTREAIGILHSDSSVEVFACEPQAELLED